MRWVLGKSSEDCGAAQCSGNKIAYVNAAEIFTEFAMYQNVKGVFKSIEPG